MIKFATTAAACALTVATAAAAQQRPDVELQKAEMAKLAGMAGTWEGAGTMAVGGPPSAFDLTETVQVKSDGLVLLIEGEGVDEAGDTVHDALGVISYDEASGEYRIRAYADGRAGTYPMTWLDNGDLRWTIAAGGAQIRYTITLEEDSWREVGEFQMQDGSFQEFMSFELTRTGDAD